MINRLIPIALIAVAPLALACGAVDDLGHEDGDGDIAEAAQEEDAIEVELGNIAQSLQAPESTRDADELTKHELELPTVSELALPDGVTARIRRTSSSSAEIEVSSAFDPGGKHGYTTRIWSGIIENIMGKILGKSPAQQCTTETETTTTTNSK